ncbi:L-2-amino-thiazoline-4-carboxylic acid hydrolase [Vallitalea guaymasensis]|uniref:L-2-amino-thiazoline-4-carboxylic acid hydrolase n=1 Tax=Vallitalea guaymasensis TaxID=1185412 RepID=A0A8J8M7I5_9FIRM|nr:L-2-amino-thiazoline-4-carboxylic acid hydrolase [Vallitalea guaymasensis]QUH27822.1 L-2-amino-thiazoline-4-carboxylic acid hydrolase [Vallitalea guaymasensis]
MKDFLHKYFTEIQTDDILTNYNGILEQMITEQESKRTSKQYKTAKTRILDRIAFYLSIRKYLDDDKALEYAKEYYYSKTTKMSNFMKKVGKSTIGCILFKKAFVSGLKADTWVTNSIQNDNKGLNFNITKCLYKDLCDYYKCPNLCKMFCDGDWLMFGKMEKLKFSREYTLGYGDDVCDFHFKNTKNKMG